MIELVLRIDKECGSMSPYGLFESKKELKELLQEQDCENSTFSTDEEYYQENKHLSLNDYCDAYEYGYIEFTDKQIEEALGDYAEKHKLKDNSGDTF